MAQYESRFDHVYRGVHVYRLVGSYGYRLPWSAYCAGRFVSADTRDGLHYAIRAELGVAHVPRTRAAI